MMISYEDVPAELAKSVVIEKLSVLPLEHSVSGGQLAYSMEWEETLQSYSQTQRRKVRTSRPWLLTYLFI